MMNRSLWILLFVAVFAASWFFSQQEPAETTPLASNSVVPGEKSQTDVDASKSLSASTTDRASTASRLAVQDKTVSVELNETLQQAAPQLESAISDVVDTATQQYTQGQGQAQTGVSQTKGSSLGQRLTEAVVAAESVSAEQNATTDAETAAEKDTAAFSEAMSYEVEFLRSPATPIGAVDVVLTWDATRLAPLNTQAVCADKSGATLYQQGIVTASSVRYALLYPTGLSSTNTLLSCQFNARKSSGTTVKAPEISGELLNLDGSVIANASSLLQVVQ